jgi:hypothetical protein
MSISEMFTRAHAHGERNGAAVPAPMVARAVAALRFALPRPMLSCVEVLDAAGLRVRLLLGGEVAAGEHVCAWDGRDECNRPTPPGEYLLRLVVDGRVLTTRRVYHGI